MRASFPDLARWSRMLLAALALLAGSGLHDLLHAFDASTAAPPTSPIEAHGSGCEHLGDEAPHDGGSCLLCKAGKPVARLSADRGATLVPPSSHDRTVVPAVEIGPRPPLAGSLGARAPPSVVG